MKNLLSQYFRGGLVLALLVLGRVLHAGAHGGEDHGAAPAGTAAGATTFSVAALSEKFELLLRYEPLMKEQDADMLLFVSDYATNAPVAGAVVTVSCPEVPTLKFTVSPREVGTYLVEGIFPENKPYSLAVNIVAGQKADLMLLTNLVVGRKLPAPASPTAGEAGLFASWKTGLALAGAFALGVGLTAFLLRRRRPALPAPTPINS